MNRQHVEAIDPEPDPQMGSPNEPLSEWKMITMGDEPARAPLSFPSLLLAFGILALWCYLQFDRVEYPHNASWQAGYGYPLPFLCWNDYGHPSGINYFLIGPMLFDLLLGVSIALLIALGVERKVFDRLRLRDYLRRRLTSPST